MKIAPNYPPGNKNSSPLSFKLHINQITTTIAPHDSNRPIITKLMITIHSKPNNSMNMQNYNKTKLNIGTSRYKIVKEKRTEFRFASKRKTTTKSKEPRDQPKKLIKKESKGAACRSRITR